MFLGLTGPSMRAALFLLVRLLAPALVSCWWAAGPPMPAAIGTVQSCTTFGDSLVVNAENKMFLYRGSTAGWTSLTPMPSSRGYFPNAISPYDASLVAVGGSQGSQKAMTETYNFVTDTWTTMASLPFTNAHMLAVADELYGAGVFVMGGYGATMNKNNFLFLHATNEWTSKAIAPQSLSYGAGGYELGQIFAISTLSRLYSYVIAADTWTTKKSSPTDHGSLGNGAALHGSHLYVVGCDDSTSPDQTAFERYDVGTDRWQSLPSSPTGMYLGSLGIISSGLLLYMDHDTATVYTFDTHASEAAVSGDPLFTTFQGTQHHLSLRAGVFNLLTTPTVCVNAYVDVVDALPAEENTVIQMLGVVARWSTSYMMVRCHVFDQILRCEASVPSAEAVSDLVASGSDLFSKALIENSFVLDLPSLSINVTASLAIVTESGVGLAPFLDVKFRRIANEAMSGLLPDLDSIGVDAVRERLSQHWYEADDSVTHTDIPSALLFSDGI